MAQSLDYQSLQCSFINSDYQVTLIKSSLKCKFAAGFNYAAMPGFSPDNGKRVPF